MIAPLNSTAVPGTVGVLAPPPRATTADAANATSASPASHRLRAAVHLVAVLCTAPMLISYVLRQYLQRLSLRWSRAHNSNASDNRAAEAVAAVAPAERRRTVLVTGGKMAKSLNIARALWRAGHRVVLVETDKYWCSGSRLSRAVWAFDTVADPRVGADGGAAYLADLERVFAKHGCDTFLPVSSPFSAHFDAMFLRGKPRPGALKSVASMASLSSTDEDSASQSTTDEDNAAAGENDVGGCLAARECGGGANSSGAAHGPRNLHFTPTVCDILDDKHSFWKYCTETLGLPSSTSKESDGAMLPSHRLYSDDQVLALNEGLRAAGTGDKYVLKNLGYDPLHRLDLFCLPAEEAVVTQYLHKIRADGNGVCADEPWQAQLFIEEGTETSCFAVLRDSRLELYTCCLSSASQLRYVHAGRTDDEAAASKRNRGHAPLIDAQAAACRRWVDAFCAALRARGESLDGQLCWDFMCTTGDVPRAFPLECNPRVHSQCVVFGAANGDQRRFGTALVGDGARGEERVPSMATDAEAETHFWGWWANEFFSLQETSYLLRCLEALHAFLHGLCCLLGLSHGRGARVFNYAKASDDNATWYTSHFAFRDSDFDAEDPLPFLGRNLLQPLVLFWDVLVTGNEWTKYDFCIGKVVQKNGD